MPRGIDYFIRNGKEGCIVDPRALMEFYRRVASHKEFTPKLCVYMEKPVVGQSLTLPDFEFE